MEFSSGRLGKLRDSYEKVSRGEKLGKYAAATWAGTPASIKRELAQK
ncbi:hypothetical protein U6G28_09685 [Actinomycetaceae bacterium MB13-C1-2]|nr:hypothetical protein U6G28_09685 [Actinomycetaceae bacterium MB13-C1-2]